MRLAMVGTGMIVKNCFDFFSDIEGIEVKAIVSTPRSEDKAIELCQKHGIKDHYIDINEMLKDEMIDTVYVGVPNHLHYEICKKALEANKNVICEKPFTSHIDELLELSALANERKLILLEAISTQYLPNVLKIKEMLDEVGHVKIVTANYSQYSSRYNAFKEGNILPAFDYKKSGGALMDLNIYNIHLMVALFGAPLNVQYLANIEKNIDTSGVITLDYGDFKAVLIGAKDCKAPIATNIQGDEGCIHITTPANVVKGFHLLKNDGSEDYFNLQKHEHRMYYEFVEFVKIIENKDFQRAEEMMENSLIAMEIATQARQSAGVVFKADEKRKKDESISE